MDKSSLLKLYRDVARKTGFRENKKNPGWMPKLGPNDYRSVMRHGWHKGIPSLLKVSPHEDLRRIATDFARYQKAAKGRPALQIPAILAKGSVPGAQFFIQKSADPDKPQGVRMIRNWPLATRAEKEEVAKLYWNTVSVVPAFDLREWAVSDYFVTRVEKTLATGRDYHVMTKGFITPQEKDRVVAYIFSNAHKLRMQAFFAHFANTDITKTDNHYFIWESPIVPKPKAAGIALWLWAATLYAHGIPAASWRKEIKVWIAAFKKHAPRSQRKNLDVKIRVNFAERLLGTLLMDLPLKRSPFDKLPPKAIHNARATFRVLLKEVI
jgi:hypothetical protein